MIIFDSLQVKEPPLRRYPARAQPKVEAAEIKARGAPERGLRSAYGRQSTADWPQTGPVGTLDQRP